MTKCNRPSKSKREWQRKLRQYLNNLDFRVRRGKLEFYSEIELPEDGDWSEWIDKAEKELHEAHEDL